MKWNKEQEQQPVLERDGDVMPVLGLGTFQSSGDACRNVVSTALRMGYRHIDTARMYENEKEVGQGIKESGVSREAFFLTTKLQMGELSPDGVRNSCEQSLKCLSTDYVDLLLIHWPEEDTPLADTLGAMAELKQKGDIRHFGVSNFTVDWMKRAVAESNEPIFCNQVEYHPYLDQEPVLAYCRENDMALVAYSPLARGRTVKDQVLADVGEKYGKTAAQVALRWLIQQSNVAAIPKATGEDHVRESFEIFDFELDDVDLDAINGINRGKRLIDPDWSPQWDT